MILSHMLELSVAISLSDALIIYMPIFFLLDNV